MVRRMPGRVASAVLVVALSAGMATALCAQSEWSRVLMGDSAVAFGPKIRAAADGGALWVGAASSTPSGLYLQPIARLEANGQLRWSEMIQFPAQGGLLAMEPTSDGGWMLSGGIQPSPTVAPAGWLARLDADGHILWQKELAGSYTVRFAGLTPTFDGGWATVGGVQGSPGSVCRLLAMKFSTSGAVLWRVVLDDEAGAGGGRSIQEAPDGSLLVAAKLRCFQVPGGPPWLLKLSPNGQVLWQRLVFGAGLAEPVGLAAMPDGGLVLVGFARPDMFTPASGWAVRLDASGTPLWQQQIGNPDSECMFSSVRADADGSLYILGNKRLLYGELSRDWLLKLNAQGNIIWEHTYEGGQQLGSGDLDLRPSGGMLFSASYVTDCGRLQGTRVAATDALGGLPGACAPLDDRPSVSTAGGLTSQNGTAYPVPMGFSVLDAAATLAPLELTDYELCPSTCSLACTATVPPTALPGSTVTFQATATPTACTAAPTFGWDFGDGNFATGSTATHSYRYSGSYSWTFSAFDDGQCCTQMGTIVVRPCPVLAVLPSSLNGFVKGVPCTKLLAASGGTQPYSFSVTSGALPPGLTLFSTGALSGVVAVTGTWTFSITTTDTQGCQGVRSYTLSVYDLFFDDDLGRSRFFANRTTGAYEWDVLTGAHAGEAYTGVANVLNGGAKFIGVPGSPNALNVTYDPLRKKAAGYFISAVCGFSSLTDSNTSSTSGACQ